MLILIITLIMTKYNNLFRIKINNYNNKNQYKNNLSLRKSLMKCRFKISCS